MNAWLLIIAAGLGIRHAVAPDHLAALGTYTEKTGATHRQGIWYALRMAGGHSAGMLAIAALVVGLVVALPAQWVHWTTWGSGIWLMIMSVWILWDLGQDLLRSRHASSTEHPIQETRLHAWLKNPATAWLVGLLFGLAVSPGDLAIFTLMLRTHAAPLSSFGLLALFLAAMFLGLALVGGGLGLANAQKGLRRFFQALSGAAGMGIAVALVTGFLH